MVTCLNPEGTVGGGKRWQAVTTEFIQEYERIVWVLMRCALIGWFMHDAAVRNCRERLLSGSCYRRGAEVKAHCGQVTGGFER